MPRASSPPIASRSASPADIRPAWARTWRGCSRRCPRSRRRSPRFRRRSRTAPASSWWRRTPDSTAISIGTPWTLSHEDPDWPAMSIARSAFGEHRQINGRLMQRLRERRGLNYGDYAYIEYFRQEGADAATAQTGRARHQQEFSIWLRPVRDENRLFAVRAALYELARSLKDEPFTADEVEQTKGFLDGYILLFDQTDARRLGYALDDQFYGMTGFLASWRDSLRGVTAEQVNAAWRKWIDPAKLEIVMAGRDMAVGEEDRARGRSDAHPVPARRRPARRRTSPPRSSPPTRRIETFPARREGRSRRAGRLRRQDVRVDDARPRSPRPGPSPASTAARPARARRCAARRAGSASGPRRSCCWRSARSGPIPSTSICSLFTPWSCSTSRTDPRAAQRELLVVRHAPGRIGEAGDADPILGVPGEDVAELRHLLHGLGLQHRAVAGEEQLALQNRPGCRPWSAAWSRPLPSAPRPACRGSSPPRRPPSRRPRRQWPRPSIRRRSRRLPRPPPLRRPRRWRSLARSRAGDRDRHDGIEGERLPHVASLECRPTHGRVAAWKPERGPREFRQSPEMRGHDQIEFLRWRGARSRPRPGIFSSRRRRDGTAAALPSPSSSASSTARSACPASSLPGPWPAGGSR